MGYNGGVIDIPLTSDVEGFVAELKTKLKGVKNLGLQIDTSTLEEALDKYLDAYKKIANTKLNTSTFSKAQETMGKEIDDLKRRTDALEAGFAGLISVMESAEGGKFASQLADIKDVMQDLADVTIVTTNAISSMSNAEVNNSALEKTYTLLKEIQSLKDSDIGQVTVADNFKGARKELITLFNDIQKKKKELEGIEVVSDEDKLKVAELQKEIAEMSMTWQKMYTSSSSTFEDEFTDAVVKIGKAEKSFENLYDIVGKTIGAIQENVEQNLPFIENSLKTSVGIASAEGGVTVSANLGTTTKGLIDQLQRLLDSVQPYLDENPLEVNVSIATDWGTRRNKELLKQFQTQIDNLSENTNVSEFKQIYEDIQKSFGNEINLKFKSNFDDEQKAIKAGVTALKAEIGKKFELNPKISSEAAKKLQEQLDKLSNNLILSIDSIKLTEGAIKDAGTLWKNEQGKLSIGADALSSVIDTMIAGSEKLNQELAPIWQLLVDIKSILEQYPIQSIVDSTKELVSVIQRAFNILSTEDLDSIFSGLQKRAETISGSLRLGENQKELRSLLAAYREYQELGGTHSLSELGGNDKVQQWFKRNKDIVLETTQAVEELDKAEDKAATDLKDTSALDMLSVKIDDVLTKMQGTIESLDKIRTSLIEIANVSSGEKIVSIDTENINKITTAIGDLQTAIEKIQTSLSDGTIFKGLASLTPKDAENIEKVVGALAEMANVMPSGDFVKNISKIRSFVNTFSKEKGIERIEKAAEGVNKLREALDGEVSSNSLLLIFQKISESADVSGLLTELKALLKVETAANQAAVAKKDFSEANKKMEESAEDSSVAVEKEKAALQKVLDKLDGLNQAKFMPGYLEQINEIKVAMNGIDDSATDAVDSYKKLIDEANKLWKERGFSEWKKSAESSIASLEAKIAKFARTNTAMGADFKRQLDVIRQSIKPTMSIEEVADLTTQFKKLDAAVNDAGQTGASFFDTLRKRAMGVNAQLIAQYLSFQDFIRYARQAIEVVKDLDYALVDLKKTTTMTADELNQFYFEANDVARQMGVTTEEIINQAAAWSRLGYSSKEAATEMAALSSQFAQISPGMDVEKATDGLVSAMKAFHVDVADVESEIMDVINKTGNTMATTNEEIVDMLERSSSAMSAANNTIKETIALESAAVQITRNAETTGTAFRTISMRIRGYDEETEEYIGDIEELTGKIADLTKSAKTPGGISLFTDETKSTYKSTYQILKDISEIYNDLSDKNQAELLETLAGKRGGQVLAGILQDFSEVERAMNNMAEAAGSADAEMSIVEESLTYKINNLKETWVGIIQELIDNGMLGQLIDALTAISEALGKIITTIGPVPTIIAGFGLRELLLNLDKLPELVTTISTGVQLLTEGSGTLLEVIGAMSPALGTLLASLAPIAPYLLAIAAAAAALYGIYKIWDAMTISVEEANKALEEFNDKYNKATSEMESHKKAVDKLSDSYFELAKGVDSVSGKNISLTDEDYKEFVQTNQELAEMFPELISGVDEYGNYILNLGSNADEARKKLAELLQQEKDNYNYELYKDLPTVSENAIVKVQDAKNQIDTNQELLNTYNNIYDKLNDIAKLPDDLDSPFTILGDVNDQDTTKVINDFVIAYQGMIDELAMENPEIASNLRAALKDESVGDEIKKVFHLENLSAEEKAQISTFVKDYVRTLSNDYKGNIATATKEVKAGQSQLSSAWMSMQKNIIGGINFLSENGETTKVLTSFVSSLPAEFAESLEDVDLQDEIAKWIEEVDELPVQQKIQLDNLINGDLTPQEKIQLYDELRANLPDSFDIPIHYIVDENQNLIDRVKYSKSRLSKSINSFGAEEVNQNTLDELDAFFKEMQIDTEEEYNLWLKVAEASDTATEAMRKYRNEVKKVKSETTSATILDSVEGINKRFGSQFKELRELYSSIFYGNNGFSLKDVSVEQLKELKDSFIKLVNEDGKDIGVTFEEGEKAVNKLIDTLTSAETKSKSVAEQEKIVQQAFNDFATDYFYAADGLKELNEKTADSIKQMFKEMGITNADEIVDYYLNLKVNQIPEEDAKKALNEIGIDDPTDHQIDYYIRLHLDSDYKDVKSKIESVYAEMDKLGEGGNVDLRKRPQVSPYRMFLNGWDTGGSDATVFTSTYANEAGNLAINLTPIVTDENGNVTKILSPSDLQAYAEKLLAGADDDLNLQIGMQFSGENAEEEAEKAAQRVHELQDAFYNLNLKGVFGDFDQEIASIWDDFDKKLAEGKTNADEILNELKAAANEGFETEDLNHYAELLGVTTEQLADLLVKEQLVNSAEIDTSEECTALLALAGDAQYTEEVYQKLLELLDIYTSVEAGVYGQGTEDRAKALERANQIKKEIDELLAEGAKEPPAKYNPKNTNKNNGSGSSEDAWKKAFEEQKAQLEYEHQAGLMSEKEYLNKLKDLIEKFYKDREKYAKEYADEMKSYMDALMSYYNSVVSGVVTLFDSKINKLNREKEKIVDKLQKEQEAAEKVLQDQIDALQDQMDAIDEVVKAKEKEKDAIQDVIDAINEANEARDRSIQLQKAEYEIQRMQHQRSKLVYTGEVGQMRYERDESGLRDARENLKDAQDQMAIAALEKEIKLIDDSIDKLNDQKEALETQQNALQKQLDKTTKHYEELIKAQEKYYEELTKPLEEIKQKWEDLAEIETVSKAWSLVAGEMKDLGFTVEDVLNDTPGAFEAFKEKYLKVLSEMHSGDADFLDGLQKATNDAKGAFSEVSKSAGEIETALEKVSDATTPLTTASDNITSMGNAASTASKGVSSLKESTDGIAADVDSLNSQSFDGLTKALGDVKKEIENVSNALTGPTNSIKSAIDTLNDTTLLTNLESAFSKLGEAITSVAGLLGVATAGAQDATETTATSTGADAAAGAGLAKAIEEIKNAADTYIGKDAEETEETAIGRFNLLKTAIKTLVDEVIGNTEVEGTLIGSINSLPQITEDALAGDEGAIAKFDDFAKVLDACAQAASNLLTKLQEISSTSLPSIPGAEGTEGEYTGTAKYTGDWSVGKNEKALVGELGPEAILRNGKYTIVGNNGPEFVNLRKDDIVLNHKQTSAILDKKNQIRALADGSVLSPISSAMSATQEKLKGLVNGNLPSVGNIRTIINNQTKEIQKSIDNIAKVSPNPSITITNPSFTVSGVTGEEVMRKIEGSFEGLMLNAYQKAMS